jgi:hypothetical protein
VIDPALKFKKKQLLLNEIDKIIKPRLQSCNLGFVENAHRFIFLTCNSGGILGKSSPFDKARCGILPFIMLVLQVLQNRCSLAVTVDKRWFTTEAINSSDCSKFDNVIFAV